MFLKKNKVTKISNNEYIIINGIISYVFKTNKYTTEIKIIIKLTDQLLNFSLIYNEIENTFESYYAMDTNPLLRIRHCINDDTKFLFIGSRNNLFFSTK